MSYTSFDFPHTHFYDDDLRELLKKVFELNNDVKNFISINAIKYANPIQWDITSQYEKNTIVIDPLTGTAYISVDAVPSGVALTREEFWTPVFDLGQFVVRASKNFSNRYEQETTLTATFATSAGQWLVWGDTLYVANVNITPGDSYVVDGNIRHITVEEAKNTIMQLIADNYDAIIAMIGDLNELNTTAKENVVAAINEVVTRLSNEVQTLQGNINNEALSRQDADTALQGNINNEALARQDADTALQGNINNEALARANADEELRNLILSSSSYYDTISDFKEDTTIISDKNYVVNGYYTSGDCSIMIWNTTNTATSALGEIQLDNGLYAHLLKIDDKYFDAKQYGAYGDGVHDDFDILNDVINAAVAEGAATVYLPEGKYKIRTYLSSLRTASTDGQTLKDLNNLTLCGSGDLSIIYGEDPASIFDILQLNQVKNITIKDLKLYEIGTTTAHGANGVSITNGGMNITLENITVESLPYYVGTGYVDGGKGFTLQWEGTPAYPFKDIIIRNCRVNNSPIGFELDVYNTTEIVNNIVVESCKFNVSYCGFIVSSVSASNNTSVIFTNSVINTTQRGIWVARGKNVIANNITIEQTEAITNILPSDLVVAGVELYATTEGCYLNNVVCRYTNGVYCVLFRGSGSERTSGVTISNMISLGSYTQKMFMTSVLAPTFSFFLNNLNYAAPATYDAEINTANLRNDIFGNASYNILNKMFMTNEVTAHTLGTYSGKSIAVYNTLGQLQGYLPLYN